VEADIGEDYCCVEQIELLTCGIFLVRLQGFCP
jgi:hypothetical protein